MNKKIKQAVAIALALVMCAGVFLYNPQPVLATVSYKPFFDISEGLQFSQAVQKSDGMVKIRYVIDSFSDSNIKMFGIKQKDMTYYYAISLASATYTWQKEFFDNNELSNIVTYDCSIVAHLTYDSHIYYYSQLMAASDITSDVLDFKCLIPYVVISDDQSVDLAYWCDAVFSGVWDEFTFDGVGVSSSYENAVDDLGYIVDVHASNVIETETNGGKDWINRIKYSRKTSTDFDLKSDGADVQYFFVFNGSAKTKLGLGSKIDMSEYISDARYAGNEHMYFSYSSDDWRAVYQNWMSANNLSSTDRVVDTDVEIWMRPVYKENIFSSTKVGGWTVLTEDGGTYLIDSDETCNYDDDNSDLKPGRDSNTSNGDSNKTDNSQKIGVDLDDSDAVEDGLDNGNHVNTTDQIKDQFNDFDLGNLPTILEQLGEAAAAFAGLIGVVFSWMPSWVRASLIAAVCIWIFMLIKRAIF